jgi:hypothetical protein
MGSQANGPLGAELADGVQDEVVLLPVQLHAGQRTRFQVKDLTMSSWIPYFWLCRSPGVEP